MWICSKNSNNPRKGRTDEEVKPQQTNIQSRRSDVVVACLNQNRLAINDTLNVVSDLWNINICADIHYDEIKTLQDFMLMAEKQGNFLLMGSSYSYTRRTRSF